MLLEVLLNLVPGNSLMPRISWLMKITFGKLLSLFLSFTHLGRSFSHNAQTFPPPTEQPACHLPHPLHFRGFCPGVDLAERRSREHAFRSNQQFYEHCLVGNRSFQNRPCSRSLALALQHLPPLSHHMRVQNITSRHVNE